VPCPPGAQGRALFVPAGIYVVHASINVRPSTGENAGFGTMGLNIMGEGRELTEVHAPRVWSHCGFRNRGTESLGVSLVYQSGIQRVIECAKRQWDRTL
jgi:hypothetical protein